MEVRTRSSSNQRTSNWTDNDVCKESSRDAKGENVTMHYQGGGPTIRQRIRRETWEMTRVLMNLIQGRASKVTYLLIPAMISLFWLLICIFTTRQPSLTIEERLRQDHYRVSLFTLSTSQDCPLVFVFCVHVNNWKFSIFSIFLLNFTAIFWRWCSKEKPHFHVPCSSRWRNILARRKKCSCGHCNAIFGC